MADSLDMDAEALARDAKKRENDPNTYKRSGGRNDPINSLEDIYRQYDELIPADEWPKFEAMTKFVVEANPQTPRALEKTFILLRRQYKTLPKKSQIKFVYNALVKRGEAPPHLEIDNLLVKKAGKSQSGVLVVTVLTSPYPHGQKFSCQWNCYYCPNEPDQPRSYLHDEPSVLRANRNSFDPVLQFCDRCVTLALNGHPVDKIELLVLGGTWASYPVSYQEEFIRDLFYAANTFHDRVKRDRKSLDEEKKENETTSVKIIGITLETRPDCITPDELRRFRRFGCTRVQLGIQHTDEGILKKINRGCTTTDAKRAMKLLRDCGYKTDIHLMPNLPGSSVELDRAMFEYVLHSPDLQADQWKIYPCEVTPWTVIKRWYDAGEYVPYSDHELMALLMDIKAQVHPWIRLNRVIRDIPSQYILGGVDEPNLRQVILKRMEQAGRTCRCIRCREIKSDARAATKAILITRTYEANDGTEYFLSFETPDESTICGFCRLRLSPTAGAGVFPELAGCALVRELHVYGQLVAVNSGDKSKPQHIGFGTQLMLKAEEIARAQGYTKMAVIAGVGVRNFYRKLGFEVEGEGELMTKQIPPAPGLRVFGKTLDTRVALAAATVALAVGVAFVLKKRS